MVFFLGRMWKIAICLLVCRSGWLCRGAVSRTGDDGYTCQSSGLIIEPWQGVDTTQGSNVVFVIQYPDSMNSETSLQLQNITTGVVDFLQRYVVSSLEKGMYSLGLVTFSQNANIQLLLGECSTGTACKGNDIEFFKAYRQATTTGLGNNVSYALEVAYTLFDIHRENRIYAPNLCILLTTSPPDDKSKTIEAAATLKSNGVTIMNIAVGSQVTREDVAELASNDNIVFTTGDRSSRHPDEDTQQKASTVVNQVIDSIRYSRFLPTFSWCYQAYIDFFIIVDLTTDHINVLRQVRDFIVQFNQDYATVRVMVINSPITNTQYMAAYWTIISTARGMTFDTFDSRHNLQSSLLVAKRHFEDKNIKRNLCTNITMIVTDFGTESNSSVVSVASDLHMNTIHVLLLRVGSTRPTIEVSQIISDPRGQAVVPTTDDVRSGLETLNRKLCPEGCDKGWIYYNGTCYHRRETSKSWFQSKNECKGFNGKLVCVTDEEKFNWLAHTFLRNTSLPLHIGLRKHFHNKKAAIGSYLRWENGKPLVFSNWSSGDGVSQPDGAVSEACVAWFPDGWRDIGCALELYGGWICERVAGNYTQPKTIGVELLPFSEEITCPVVLRQDKNISECRPVIDVFARDIHMDQMYICNNGELISKHLLCDGVSDCRDGGDETNCTDECTSSQFQCTNGRCVSLAYFCDFWDDCGDNSDEQLCVHPECPRSGWQCDSGQCVPSTNIDCDLYYDCFDKSDEARCTEETRQSRCYDGTYIPDHWLSDGQVDCPGPKKEDEVELKRPELCYYSRYRDLPFLLLNKKYAEIRPQCVKLYDSFGKYVESFTGANCTNSPYTCPIGFYQCPSSYCIPLEKVCDGVMHCRDGEDEIGCDTFKCPGYFRCPGATNCFHPSFLCNGEVNCPGGKDEVMCNFRCPDRCTCLAGSVECVGFVGNSSTPFDSATRSLTLIRSSLLIQNGIFDNLTYLIDAKLNWVGLKIVSGLFNKQVNLRKLNVSNNNISEIPRNSFAGLGHLKSLDLSFNEISVLEAHSLSGLDKLEELHMKHMRIQVLTNGSFLELLSLRLLDISDNSIHRIEVSSFSGLGQVLYLHMQGNPIGIFESGIYDGLKDVVKIKTDIYSLCCPQVRPKKVETCEAPQISISSCSDLMATPFLRASIWMLCVAALMGNVMSIILRMCWERASMKNGFGVFVTHLGIADFLMGAYLLIIAIADIQYTGIYIWHDYAWRRSVYCKAAGFLATLSSEASSFFICLITMDRFLIIKYPFGQLKFRHNSATAAAIIAWMAAVVIAGVPLLPAFSHWNFYSRNAACLALPFSTERLPGWIYSSSIFIGLNFVAFIFIAIGQYSIYRTMKASSIVSSSRRNDQEMAVARRLLLIVSTDFLCWFPVGVMSLLALGGTQIGGDVFAWTAVLVLPVNSALNPFLYTIPAVLQKLRQRGYLAKKQRNSTATTTVTTFPSVPVTFNNHGDNQILLEDVLLKVRSKEVKVKLMQEVMSAVAAFEEDIPKYCPEPNAIYIGKRNNAVESICLSQREGHKPSKLTQLSLSLILPVNNNKDVMNNNE